MLITIIDGSTQDEQRLLEIAYAAGYEFRIEHERSAPNDAATVAGGPDDGPRALVFEALDRPDLANAALRAVREAARFDGATTIVVLTAVGLARSDPWSGFDDFVVHPYRREELHGRIRTLRWRRADLRREVRQEIGGIQIDRIGHEVRVSGRSVALTAREFALLVYFLEQSGRALSRQHILAHVWGGGYEGGVRTVDIHVRRLRAKLGETLPLETLRGTGYKLRKAS